MRDTFKSIIGKFDYTIIDIQLNKNANEENVKAIQNLAKDYIFSDQRSSNEEVRAVRFFFCYFYIRIPCMYCIYNCIQYYKQHEYEYFGKDERVWIYESNWHDYNAA